MRRPRAAVLGAGIMGSSLAIFLARRGVDVLLVDRADAPVAGSSRWNEGKIHLGYLYGADPSLATARHILPGGLRFAPLMSELVGEDISSHATTSDDTYLIHRRSVVDLDALRPRFHAVAELARSHPDAASYLTDLSRAEVTEIPRGELDALATDNIVAGFRVPERSVETRWLADRLAAAVAAEPRVTLRLGTTVTGTTPVESPAGPWRVHGTPDLDERVDVVLNALWEGRLAVDRVAGLTPDYAWTHRYRLCLFTRTARPVDVRSAIAAVGPFGDVKSFAGRDFYLSWYPVGLVAQGDELVPPPPRILSGPEETRFVEQVRAGLESVMPGVGRVLDEAEEVLVRGGYVFARGSGSIADAASALHRRDRFGVERRGAYLSIDTGKYSTAPWVADRLAREIADT